MKQGLLIFYLFFFFFFFFFFAENIWVPSRWPRTRLHPSALLAALSRSGYLQGTLGILRKISSKQTREIAQMQRVGDVLGQINDNSLININTKRSRAERNTNASAEPTSYIYHKNTLKFPTCTEDASMRSRWMAPCSRIHSKTEIVAEVRRGKYGNTKNIVKMNEQ